MKNELPAPLWRAEAPGNILIFGEYFILDEGGIGYGAGIGPSAILEAFPLVHPRKNLVVLEGFLRSDQAAEEWFLDLNSEAMTHPQSWEDEVPLLHAVWSVLAPLAQSIHGTPLQIEGVRLRLDTRKFYSENRKLGYGSSAAAAALLTAGLMRIFDIPGWEQPSPVFPLAVQAHRVFQGNRGSGYDVAASCFGGLGRFVGGALPSWEPLQPAWLPSLGVFPGQTAIQTKRSIASYEEWKRKTRHESARLLRESNSQIRAFLAAPSWTAAEPHARTLREIGLTLGDALGRSARIAQPDFPHLFAKASGAGNELGVAFGVPNQFRQVPSARGLHWVSVR